MKRIIIPLAVLIAVIAVLVVVTLPAEEPVVQEVREETVDVISRIAENPNQVAFEDCEQDAQRDLCETFIALRDYSKDHHICARAQDSDSCYNQVGSIKANAEICVSDTCRRVAQDTRAFKRGDIQVCQSQACAEAFAITRSNIDACQTVACRAAITNNRQFCDEITNIQQQRQCLYVYAIVNTDQTTCNELLEEGSFSQRSCAQDMAAYAQDVRVCSGSIGRYARDCQEVFGPQETVAKARFRVSEQFPHAYVQYNVLTRANPARS